MKKRILKEFENVEKEYNVKIIYAVESGSRCWGFESADSDYDVRFIYIHPKDWYLTINEKRDVIERPIIDELDVNGWDIRKTLKLFRKSNSPLIEWLYSPIIYKEKYSLPQELRRLSEEYYYPKRSIYHYLSMARGNYKDYLLGDTVKLKKYLYVLRPLLACKWIEKHNTRPPVVFEDLTAEILKGELYEEVQSLVRRKKEGTELGVEPPIPVLNEYISEEIEHLTELAGSLPKEKMIEIDLLDSLFRDTLEEVWEDQ